MQRALILLGIALFFGCATLKAISVSASLAGQKLTTTLTKYLHPLKRIDTISRLNENQLAIKVTTDEARPVRLTINNRD